MREHSLPGLGADLIGTFLDNRYEVLQKVGEGGMATVYRGRHNTLKRDVAIKVLHPHLSSSIRNRKRFAREARAIEHLRHDNILQIFDYSGLDTSECYIITEFVEGQTLSHLLAECGQLPSEVATLVGLHLARALTYAHAEGILHRDLKPDNVMIRADGTVKLMDFGIARFLDESQVTMTGALVGSPAFMSPEQAKEEPLDRRSDLFSLGTVLFYLVTGYLPFTGSNPSLILKNVIEGNRPHVTELAPAMSASLADAIEQLMTSSADDRFNGADEVTRALEDCLDEVGVLGNPSFGLARFVENPQAFERGLDDHLKEQLLARGKALLERGDHLRALHLFNRLLSLDENNEEVLALVQGLHTSDQPQRRRGWLLAAVLLLLLCGGAGGIVAENWDELEHNTAEGSADPENATPPEPAVGAAPRPPSLSPITGPPPTAVPPPAPVEVPDPMPATVSARPAGKAKLQQRRGVDPRREIRPPVLQPETGRVKITSGEHPAEIFSDGKKIGSTRNSDPFKLPVGTHELLITSEFVVPKRIKITVSPDELTEREVQLEARPATVRFDTSYPAECSVYVDSQRVGRIGEVGDGVTVRQPHTAHLIEVRCSDARTKSKRYAYLPILTVFPPLE
ncbi:MAG: serine/threonine protein kinase [Myxococcota bacterium]